MTTITINQGTLAAFKLSGKAMLKHMDIKREKRGKNDDEGTRVVTFKLVATIGIDLINYLDPGLQSFLRSTQGIVRNSKIGSIAIDAEIPDMTAEIAGIELAGVKLSGFVVSPMDSMTAKLQFKVKGEPNGTELATISEYAAAEVDLDIFDPNVPQLA